MDPNIMISLESVSLVLPAPGGVPEPIYILQDIYAKIQQGEAVSIIGPSGSGKTSLMMVIAGIERVSSGKVIVAGEDISHYSEDRLAAFRRKSMGVVFQNFHLIPTMSALENVMVAIELSGEPQARKRAEEVLAEVGLSQRFHHYPDQLSGGEQQRVALARACATRPAILLADEPTGNLDSATGAHIIELLFGLQEKYQTTLVLITHDSLLAQKATRTLRMQDGKLYDT